jgi:phenylacetate-CoA ligase
MKKLNLLSNYLLRYNYLFKSRLDFVKAMHELEHTRLEEIKNEKFLKLLQKAYKRSPFYQRYYAEYGVNIHQIKSLDDVVHLPVINKEHIRKYCDDFLTSGKSFLTKGYTSGTSGTPLKLYRSYSSVIEENAYLWAQRSLAGHQPGMKAVSLRGDLDALTKECFDPYTNTLYLSSFSLKEENARWYYEKIRSFQPNAIYAYPSSMETICNLFQSINKTFPVNYIFTSSETLYEFQRQKISQIFGSRVFDWYGNAERTVALEEMEEGTYREAPLYSINEYKENHILTTGLINDHFPLIRYEVDDIIELDLNDSTPEKEIRGIQGRKDDLLTFYDGTRIGRMSGALKGVENVKLTQIVQSNLYSFTVNVVPSPCFTDEDKKILREKISSKVGDIPFDIKMVKESEIIRTKAGKYKLIVNMCSVADRSYAHVAH